MDLFGNTRVTQIDTTLYMTMQVHRYLLIREGCIIIKLLFFRLTCTISFECTYIYEVDGRS